MPHSKEVTRKEEIFARRLYQELRKEFYGSLSPILKFVGLERITELKSDVKLSIAGDGVHWHCVASKESRQCTINCFNLDWTNLEYKGPEYYTSFEVTGQTIVTGRTFDRTETIGAIKDWLNNRSVNEMYIKFSFIDSKKRQLERLRDNINESYRELLTIGQNEVTTEYVSSHSLWFKNDNRSCKIFYYGYENDPRYIFYWDDSTIFEVIGKNERRLGELIMQWVLRKEMPSTLKLEFPEIDFGQLSEYYENGNGIEGEFMLSWDSIETFFSESELDGKVEILKLIRELRNRGFDKTLRAGQSLYTLVLSRSRRHGLREDQDSVSFLFGYADHGMEVRTRSGQILQFEKIAYNETVAELLKTFELESIK